MSPLPASEDTPSSSLSSTTTNNNEASTTQAATAVAFARLIGKLKTTPRTGWVRKGVPRYESVADHSWRVATLAFLLYGREDLDASRCLQMALVHDLAESLVGDIAPDDNVSKEDKEKLEEDAIQQIASTLGRACPNGETSKRELLSLFHEHEKRESKEAKAVKDLDLLDMIIQADEYEQAFDLDLSDFFESTPVAGFRDATVKTIAEQVHNERQERLSAKVKSDSEKDPFALSKKDQAFVAEYAKASKLSTDAVKQTIKALRDFENK